MKNVQRFIVLMALGLLVTVYFAACGSGGDDTPPPVVSGMSNADVSGGYTAVVLGFDNTGFSNAVWDGVFAMSADGKGGTIINSIALPGGASIYNTGTYSVASDGQLTINGSTQYGGIVSKDGKILTWADIDEIDGLEIGLAIKNSVGLTNSVAAGGSYVCAQFGHIINGSAAWTHEMDVSFAPDPVGTVSFTIINSSVPASVGFGGSSGYAVADDGVFTTDTDTGAIKDDGQLLVVADTNIAGLNLAKVICIRKTAGLTNGSLNGDYLLTQIGFSNTAGPFTRVLDVNSYGNGNGTFSFIAASDGATGSAPFTYIVNSTDGTFTLPGLGPITGIVEGSGKYFMVVDTDPGGDGTVELGFGIRK